MRVTESLGILLEGKESPPALVQMLQDPDSVVRIEAVEALDNIGDKNALPALRNKLIDRSPLVRGYAALAVARLGGLDESSKLEQLLRKERNAFTKACLLEALYSLGNPDVLTKLLFLLSHKNYRVRCAIANILGGLTYNPEKRNLVLKHLKASFRDEQTIAARSSLRNSIMALRVGEV
jgi:HEAT repeat protein